MRLPRKGYPRLAIAADTIPLLTNITAAITDNRTGETIQPISGRSEAELLGFSGLG